MLPTLFFFTVSFLVGSAISKQVRLELPQLAYLLAAILIGTVITCLILFGSGFVISYTPVSVSLILILLMGISLYLLRPLRLHKIILLALTVRKQLIYRSSLRDKLMGLFFILLVVWLFGRSLFDGTNGSIVAGDRLVWTDWPVHIGIAANFAWGKNVLAQNPTFAGIPLVYPFFADFISGMLLVLGATYPQAFALPAIVLTLVFFGLFFAVAIEILRESRLFVSLKELKSLRGAAFSALFLSLFWGGLGFVYWFKEAFANETTLVETLVNPPREYTFWAEKRMWFFTFLYSEILPQRAFLFGLPIFCLILLLVITGWKKRKLSHFAVAGVLSGILPFFHTHTFMSVVFLAITAALIAGAIVFFKKDAGLRKRYLETVFLYFLPLVFLVLPQIPLFLPQSQGLPFEFGWLKGKENFFLFWFKNTGFFIPLFLLGLWKGKFSGLIKLLGVSAWILFILPNIFRFAPWGYDNLKIFTFWYLVGSIFVATSLVWIWRKRPIGLIFSVLLFITLTLSGIVEVSRILNTSKVQIGLWGKADQEFAQLVKEKIPPQSVFLAAAIHDHPVVALAGRKILLGFPGNSWSWGIKGWDTREHDIHTMFKGGEAAKALWKKYGVDYIIVSDRERGFESNLDEGFIAANSQLVLEQGSTKVYKINN